jgi:Mn2+/Fe2+ NRAMP family transporter
MGGQRGILKALGPGLLFAAVSVGVSHLVQSTRAGAGYGLSLLWVVVLALVLKYPLFEFGQRYAAATGTSLLEGYRRQGRWTLVLYLLLTLGTMFTVLAAVSAITAGLAVQLTGIKLSEDPVHRMRIWSVILIGAGGAVLVMGRYPLLDKVIKVIMALLGISAIAATVAVLPELGGVSLWGSVNWTDVVTITFVVGLVGWMPTGMDVSVWQSFWALARRRQTGHVPTLRETLFDFRFGYIGTGVLAVMFVVLGTAVMYTAGIAPERTSSAKFASQVIDLFTGSLGEWSRPIILVAAFTTMFSTTLTVLDGFPRALQLLGRRFRGPEDPGDVETRMARCPGYWIWMAVLAAGAVVVLVFYTQRILDLVDLATILSFATAPFLGWLTYRAIRSDRVPPEYRPGPWLRGLALSGILFLGGFLAFYLYYRLFWE